MKDCDAYALTTPGVSRLQPYQPGKPVTELEREYGISNALKLASNENPFGASPRAVAAIKQALDGVNYYPDQHELIAALASRYGVAPETVTLGNGSNDVLDMIARVFLTPGLNAVFSQHGFAVYWLATMACSAEPRIAPAYPVDHPDMPFGHDLHAIRDLIDDNTRVVFIANPNNPTGTWFTREALSQFLAEVPAHVHVVVDEAYIEYVDEPEFPDATQWLGEHANLIVTRTFSKIYGLAGMRCGFALSSPAVADLLNRVRHPFNVSQLAVAGALAALEDDEFVANSAAANREGLTTLTSGFENLGLPVIPSVANFVTVDVKRDAAEVYELLLREGVIVRPVANYQLPTHLRVTIGRPEDNRQVLAAFERVLRA